MSEFQIIENCLMIKLPEEVDHHRAGYISEQADSYLGKNHVANVVFDFEDTKFMDSSGIGIIAGRYRQVNHLGGKVYAIHANRQIQRMLSMSGLNKLVDIR